MSSGNFVCAEGFWTKHENSILNLLPGCKSAQKSFAFWGSLLRPAAISRMSSVKCSDYWLGLGVQSEALARENHISYEFKHVGQLPLTFSEPWRMTEILLLRVKPCIAHLRHGAAVADTPAAALGIARGTSCEWNLGMLLRPRCASATSAFRRCVLLLPGCSLSFKKRRLGCWPG